MRDSIQELIPIAIIASDHVADPMSYGVAGLAPNLITSLVTVAGLKQDLLKP